MGGLQIQNVTKTFGSTTALADVSFEMADGEIVALLGPSGCGKSTLLMVAAGLEKPDRGEVLWDGRPMTHVPPHQRGFGMMFQDFALFPHKNVFENVAFGLRMERWEGERIRKRVEEALALVGLPGFGERDVNTLSGGEQQRTALARALAPNPRLLMLDEPLGSVDRTMRERLVYDLRRILHASHQTAMYVTHDQEEAFVIADRVALMNRGKIVQVGTPQEIYLHPNSLFVARFLGMDNLVPGEVHAGPAGPDRPGGSRVRTAVGEFPAPDGKTGPVMMLIRPDAVQVDADLPCRIRGRLTDVSFRGGSVLAAVEAGGVTLEFHFPAYVDLPKVGEEISLGFEADEAIQLFFDDEEQY